MSPQPADLAPVDQEEKIPQIMKPTRSSNLQHLPHTKRMNVLLPRQHINCPHDSRFLLNMSSHSSLSFSHQEHLVLSHPFLSHNCYFCVIFIKEMDRDEIRNIIMLPPIPTDTEDTVPRTPNAMYIMFELFWFSDPQQNQLEASPLYLSKFF